MKTLRSPRHKALIDALKRARLQAGLTQAVLAAKLGVAQSYVAKVEGGERRLDVVEFVDWLEATDALAASATILMKVQAAQGSNS